MSKVIATMLLAVGATSAPPTHECPSSLVYHIPDLSEDDRLTAQQYATCVSVPWLPLAAGAEIKISECAEGLPDKRSKAVQRAVKWVDHIASSLAGCETRLEIRDEA